MSAGDILLLMSLLTALFCAGLFILTRRKKKTTLQPLPDYLKPLLEEHVLFYQKLHEADKDRFANRVFRFLQKVTINGVGTTVEELDKVLIGASAVIPIFAFPNWTNRNIRYILLYLDTFNEKFQPEGDHRYMLGMVGEGAYNQMMLLSQHALREGFANKTDKHNTAIHEFVHLIDNLDGAADGVPELLLQHQYSLPWVKMIHRKIQAIHRNESDINPYAATSQAEFFAVVSEYFFERPELLRIKHPGLYKMLEKMFGSPDFV